MSSGAWWRGSFLDAQPSAGPGSVPLGIDAQGWCEADFKGVPNEMTMKGKTIRT